jgi:hypothetical protein
MDRNLIALWEQTIESQKRAIEYHKKTKNDFMVDLTQDSLKRMMKKYEEVKEKFKAS